MSGTVAIIPVKASSVGVEYSNPLFASTHNVADKYTVLESSTRLLLERHKPIAIAVFAVSCAVLFLALPTIVLLESPADSFDFPKFKRMVLLLYAGVLQSALVIHFVPRRTRRSHPQLFQYRKVLLLLLIILIHRDTDRVWQSFHSRTYCRFHRCCRQRDMESPLRMERI